MDSKEKVIMKLQYLRKELALTQNEFAKRLGMNRSYLCRIENGSQSASANFLSKVCVTFHIPLNYFDDEVPLSENITSKNTTPTIYNPNSSMYVNSAHRTLDEIFAYRGNDNKEFQKNMSSLLAYIENYLHAKDTYDDPDESLDKMEEWEVEMVSLIHDL